MVYECMKYTEVFNEIASAILPIFQHYRKNLRELNIEFKSDCTILTRADTEIQDIIVDIIKRFDAGARLIAEEKSVKNTTSLDGFVWVIDPIDGTKPFATSTSTEYCCAICVLRGGFPFAAMIFMPEVGVGNKPLLAVATHEPNLIMLNNTPYDQFANHGEFRFASTTREKESIPSALEKYLVSKGVQVKTHTTSQSIDLLRTAIDISTYTEETMNRFCLFYRENQKIWDGAPGMCFNIIAGNHVVDLSGQKILPFSDQILCMDEPISTSVLVSPPSALGETTFGMERK